MQLLADYNARLHLFIGTSQIQQALGKVKALLLDEHLEEAWEEKGSALADRVNFVVAA